MTKKIQKSDTLVKRNILLNPGPATTSDSVKMAQVVPDICPREQVFGDLMEFVSEALTEFVANKKKYSTVIFGGSGTASVEAVISSVVPHDKTLLVVNNGAYGQRILDIASAYQIQTKEFTSSPIEQIDFQALEEVLKKGSDISHIAVIHNETTTGLLNDLDQLAKITQKYSIEVIIDAMSSYAAIPIDMEKQNIHYLVASSNKNIQGMAGIGFVICENKALEISNDVQARNYYFNLYAQYAGFKKNHQMRFTPPVQTLYALKQAILETQEEGIAQRYQRYSDAWNTLVSGLEKLQLKHLVNKDQHSKIITSIQIPNGMDFDHLHDYFYELGFTIYPGKVEGFNTFRIANIGEIDSDDLQAFINELEIYLQKHV